jgi:hypothetical protein
MLTRPPLSTIQRVIRHQLLPLRPLPPPPLLLHRPQRRLPRSVGWRNRVVTRCVAG